MVSLILDLLLFVVTIPVVTMNVKAVAVMVAIISMSIVATHGIPVPTVAIPESICYVIINEGTIFIFTELTDQFRLKC